MKIQHVSIAIITALHAIYTSFYMDVFMRNNLSSTGLRDVESNQKGHQWVFWCFAFCQLVYTLWNVMRSVVFEWRGHIYFSVLTRLKIWRLTRSGPFFSVSFMLMWLPFGVFFVPSAVQFTFWMFLYDHLFLYCETTLRTLLKGEPGSNKECGGFVYNMLSGLTVCVAYFLVEFWGAGKGELYAFRFFTTACALFALAALYACGRQQQKMVKVYDSVEDNPLTSEDFVGFAQQTLNRCSMKAAMLVWAVQSYSCVFATSFFNIFLALGGRTISLPVRILILLMAYAAPHAIIAVTSHFYKFMGKKRVVSGLLMSRAIVGALFLIVAVQETGGIFCFMGNKTTSALFVFLLFLNRVLTDAMGQMQESILADLVDEDTVIFSRLSPMTAMTRQLLAVGSKPMEFVSLVVTFFFLSCMGCSHTSHVESGVGPSVLAGGTTLCTSLLMLRGWRRNYNLEGNHLQFVRMALRRRTDRDTREV